MSIGWIDLRELSIYLFNAASACSLEIFKFSTLLITFPFCAPVSVTSFMNWADLSAASCLAAFPIINSISQSPSGFAEFIFEIMRKSTSEVDFTWIPEHAEASTFPILTTLTSSSVILSLFILISSS